MHRNHCPKCLCSVHVDNEPGDRASLCKGIMDPVSVWVRKNGEWAIIHRCRLCGTLSSNRIAADDNPAMLMSCLLYTSSGRCTAGRINRFDTELCGRRISLYSAEGNEPEGLGGKHRQKKGNPDEKQGNIPQIQGRSTGFPSV